MPQPQKEKTAPKTFIEEARRAQIIEAARKIFLTHGFEKATISEIAKAISVSKGVILYHFGNKSELGKAVLSEIIDQYSAYISAELGKLPSAIERLTEFPVVCAHYIESHQDDFLLYFDTLGAFGNVEDKRVYMAEVNGMQRSYLTKLLNSAKQDGHISGVGTQDLADIIQAFSDGISSQFCAEPDKVSPVKTAKLFRAMLKVQFDV